MKSCEWCGNTFTPKRHDQRTCSRPCRIKYGNAKFNAQRYVIRQTIPCGMCGVEFIAPRSDSKHCSATCRARAKWKAQRPDSFTLKCRRCGKFFEWPNRRPLYCGDRCQQRAGYDRTAENRRATSRAWNRANCHTEAYRLGMQVKYNRRRARKLAAGGVGVTLAEWERILRRAGGCYYCGRDEKLTMEHVIPLSRGGTHSPGNVVPACGKCNSSKGGKLVIEWRIRTTVRLAA